MNADSGELDGEGARGEDAALGRLDELRHVAVAWVEGRECVDEADDGLGERVVTVAERFDEDFAQEEREVRVAWEEQECQSTVHLAYCPPCRRTI